MEMAGFSSPGPSPPPLFVFHSLGYQLVAASEDDDIMGGIDDIAKWYEAFPRYGPWIMEN